MFLWSSRGRGSRYFNYILFVRGKGGDKIPDWGQSEGGSIHKGKEKRIEEKRGLRSGTSRLPSHYHQEGSLPCPGGTDSE